MADIQYEVNLDALKEPLVQSHLYDGYGPSDFYVNTSAITSAQQFLPEFSIDGIGASSDQQTQDERFNALIAELLSQNAGENLDAGGGPGNDRAMALSKNQDGTFTHAVEKGDSYWKVARNVLMLQLGTDDPSAVKNSDVAKVMDQLIAFNGENRQSADHLKVGQEIRIPKEIGDAVKKVQGETIAASTSESGATQAQTAEQRFALNTAVNGVKVAELKLNPVDGTYNPLQPPGLEQGQSGDYDTEGFWNYDIEGRKTVSDVTNKFTGMRTVSYEGQVDSGYGANMVWWNDTPFTATENVNANGVVTYRRVDYQDSSVKMNFEDGAGKKVSDYVLSVENQLDPVSGKYNSRITTVDGKVYSMQVDGQTGEVIRDSISVSGVS